MDWEIGQRNLDISEDEIVDIIYLDIYNNIIYMVT